MERGAPVGMEKCVWVESLERKRVDADPSASVMLYTFIEDPFQATPIPPITFQQNPTDSKCVSQCPDLEGVSCFPEVEAT